MTFKKSSEQLDKVSLFLAHATPSPTLPVSSPKEITIFQDLFMGNYSYDLPCTVSTCCGHLGKREDLEAHVTCHVGTHRCTELTLLLSMPSWPIGKQKL